MLQPKHAVDEAEAEVFSNEEDVFSDSEDEFEEWGDGDEEDEDEAVWTVHEELVEGDGLGLMEEM